ncbi:MAG TPA: methyltransferase family protein [Candidatus Brocadiaceae bacterium]
MKKVSDSYAFKHRGLVGVACLFPLGIAVFFSSPLIAENTFIDFATDVLGWVCFGLYVTFRTWSTLYVGGRKDKELQTQGPYSITRNPLYFGSFCFALSVSFFLESISMGAAIVIAGIIYSRWVIATEEQVLQEIFGDTFLNYIKNTPRFIPRFSQYRSPDFLEVNLRALRTEAKRLWFAMALPIIIERIMYLRTAPWWPHWFILP